MTVKELINILNQYDPNIGVATRHYSYFNCIGCREDAYIDPDEEALEPLMVVTPSWIYEVYNEP